MLKENPKKICAGKMRQPSTDQLAATQKKQPEHAAKNSKSRKKRLKNRYGSAAM